MTRRKHLKKLVRERMSKTGERYAAARRQVLARIERRDSATTLPFHFPGSIPATTALRVLLSAAGVRNPRAGEPFSESMLFGLAGGIGAGVFSFYYEQANFSSFFIAGRHKWEDDVAYLKPVLERFGFEPTIRETGGKKAADKHLREGLAGGLPVIAWVDFAGLPHRAMPAYWSGGGYHVVTVYEIDDAAGEVLIGDLTDDPVAVPIDVFADARARIKKFKNRVLTIDASTSPKVDLDRLIPQGLSACVESLTNARMKNFTLDAFKTWADRIHGGQGKESWDTVFPPGPRLWQGLTSVYDFAEHYGTGGGLCRPLFAEFFNEAGEVDATLKPLAERYGELGRLWTELADAALPDDVTEFRQAKALLAEKAELTFSGGPDAPEQIRAIWRQLSELQQQAQDGFPLDEAGSAELRRGLKARILDLHEKESAALDAVRHAVAT